MRLKKASAAPPEFSDGERANGKFIPPAPPIFIHFAEINSSKCPGRQSAPAAKYIILLAGTRYYSSLTSFAPA